MESSDAAPHSHSHSNSNSQYHRTPVSIFPEALDDMSISESTDLHVDVHPIYSAQVPFAEVNVPQVDPIVQLLQGFRSMFAQQEQDRLNNRVERQRFEATIQGLMTSTPHRSSSSVFSQVDPDPVRVPIEQ
jgi:hypothetical protein